MLRWHEKERNKLPNKWKGKHAKEIVKEKQSKLKCSLSFNYFLLNTHF